MKRVLRSQIGLAGTFSNTMVKAMVCCTSLLWAGAALAATNETASDTIEHNASVISEQSSVDSYELVVDVKIENALNQVNPALSAGGYIVADSIVYKMTIVDVVKGDKELVDNKLSLNIPFAACHRILTKGQRYILQVNADDLGSVHVDSCDNLASLPIDAADDTHKIAKGALQNTGS